MTTRMERIAAANEIIPLFNRNLRMELRKGRIWLVYSGSRRTHERAAVLNRCGSSLGCNYGRMGMGGTCASAVAMLVRWVRDWTRVPRGTWEYWTGSTVKLGGENAAAVLAAIDASDYHDDAKTCCVLCGNPRIGDWWDLDGVTGPCCGWSTGCRQRAAAPAEGAREGDATR